MNHRCHIKNQLPLLCVRFFFTQNPERQSNFRQRSYGKFKNLLDKFELCWTSPVAVRRLDGLSKIAYLRRLPSSYSLDQRYRRSSRPLSRTNTPNMTQKLFSAPFEVSTGCSSRRSSLISETIAAVNRKIKALVLRRSTSPKLRLMQFTQPIRRSSCEL